ncbi:MAG: hypothetical protein GY870_21265, partial [archaeon]|nr:hypothetical protein [archaeon]
PKKDNKYILVMLGMGVPCFDFKDEDGNSIGDRIRWDYDKTLSDLFCDEYTKTMSDWAEKHKLKSRIQAYGIEADTLKVWGLSHISETEQLYAGGTIDFHKFAGSSGAINAQPITCSETLIWMHRDYLTNPLKWKISADRLLISGINQMIYHGYPYQNPDFPYPGFHYSTPYISNTMRFSTNCNTMNSLSDFFPYLNLYISRGQYAMQHGKTICKIGTYYPLLNYCDGALKRDEITEGVIDDYDCKHHGPPSPGNVKEKGFDKHELWLLEHLKIADNLMENGYNYTHINEESILNAEIDGKVLKIGICEFETLIFNCIESVSVELAEKIKKIVEADIPVVFIDQIPDRQRGFFNYKENDKKIKQVLHEEIREKIQFIKKDTDLSDFLKKDLNITPQVIFDCKQPTIQFIHKKTDNSDIYYLRHSVKTPLKISAKFKHGNKIPYVMDPSTGNVQQLSQYTRIDDGNLISTNLYFEGYGSIILEFRDVDDNTEESTYIIECPIKTERLEEGNGKISGLIDTPGNYSFKLSDGTEKNVTIHENEIASPIRLKQWNFHSDIRDYLGNYSPLDLVINDETNWMDIKELKYSSDRGIYSSTFSLTKEYLKENSKLILNLGRVCEVALVKINEKELDPILFYPYESDITEFVQEGENSIEVTVVPTLHNQLVGYAKKDSKNFHNHKNRPLIPSGLVKPVRIFQKIMVKFD